MSSRSRLKHALYVDDEPDLVWSVAKRFEDHPEFRVTGFTEPALALEEIERLRPAALVTDVRMPAMSGIDLLVRAREQAPGLPAIVVTAYGTPEVRETVRRFASLEYLEKPFTTEELTGKLRLVTRNPAGFSGAVAMLSLPDVVQMYALSRFTGRLSFENEGKKASLFFEAGEITDAQSGAYAGAEAVFRALSWPSGGFEASPGERPSRRTIEMAWQELLMEGCRRLDEASAGAGEPPETGAFLRPGEPDAQPHDTSQSSELSQTTGREDGPKNREKEMANVKESLEKLAELDGYMCACVVDSNSGMMLGSHGSGVNLEVAAAGNTEVVRAKRKTMQNLGLKDSIEDILITLGKQFHLIRPSASKEGLFVYVVLDRSRANLAMGRHKLADVESGLAI